MHTALLKVVPVTICLLLLTPVTLVADDAADEFSLGVGLYRKGRYEQAADTFSGFLQQYPQHTRAPLARLYFGLSLHSLEKYPAAHRELIRFVNENPQSPHLASARYRIGESSFYARDYRSAITELTAYLERHKSDKLVPWGQLFCAESHARVKQYAKAEALLTDLLSSTTDPQIVPEARFELALTMELQDRDEDAIAAFEKLADGDFGIFSARSLAHIGTIYFQKSQFVEASRYYDRIVTAFPKETIAISATLQSAAAQYSLQNYQAAIDRLQSVPDEHPKVNEARMLRGLCLRQLGQLSEARTELKTAFAAAGSSPAAAGILFQRAELERLDNNRTQAASMFLDLADRWPRSEQAADALLNAAETRMELRQLKEARSLLTRLRADYPAYSDSPLLQLLTGRILLIEDKAADAVAVLQQATASASLTPAQKTLCQYHLIRALHRDGKYEDVVRTFQDSEAAFLQATSDGVGQAISLAAVSHLELKQYPQAESLANEYLAREADVSERIDALATKAVACARQQKFDETRTCIDELRGEHPEHPQTWRAVLLSAESAWARKEYAEASSLYVLASRYKQDQKVQESGLAGFAWSRFELNDYESAMNAFGRLAEDFSDSAHAAESTYMTGFCAQEAGSVQLAADTYKDLFDRLESAVTKDNTLADARWAFDAGIAYARLQVTEGKRDLADRMYARITTAFAKREQIDATWDEWAAAHYQARDYSRADEINRQIVALFPGSSFAPNARLSLAESAMVDGQLEQALQQFRTLDENADTPDSVREIALTNMIDILSARAKWDEVLTLSSRFQTLFADSTAGRQVDLFRAEALLNTDDFEQASDLVSGLKTGIQDGTIAAGNWGDRVWILAAEIALAQKQYDRIDTIEREFEQRSADSRFRFQLNLVQGLRWKNQAAPDFEKSRDYLLRVTKDDVSRGTKTAAKCQFLIAETYLLQQDTKTALREYLRVYINYAYDDWRAPALFQAALCEEELGNQQAARKSLNDVITEFPGSAMAERARDRLKELAGGL